MIYYITQWLKSGQAVRNAMREGGRMTKRELEQLGTLKKEILVLERRITALGQMEIQEVKDSVKSSSKDWPYIEEHTVIQGLDWMSSIKRDRNIERLEVKLKNMRRRVIATELALEEYIESIDDSFTRLIFRYRYIDGFSYEELGDLMHCHRTTVVRTMDRYLKYN